MNVYTCTCKHTSKHSHTHTRTHIHTHARAHIVHQHSNTRIKHLCVICPDKTHTHIRKYVYTYANIYANIHANTHAQCTYVHAVAQAPKRTN